jgi:hypothetical protein
MIHLLWLAGVALIIWKYCHHALRSEGRGTVSAEWLLQYRRQARPTS